MVSVDMKHLPRDRRKLFDPKQILFQQRSKIQNATFIYKGEVKLCKYSKMSLVKFSFQTPIFILSSYSKKKKRKEKKNPGQKAN